MTSEANICWVVVNEHHRVFDELVEALHRALPDIGAQSCVVSKNRIEPGKLNIVLGHTFCVDLRPFFESGIPYIALQLEQLSDDEGFFQSNPNYRQFLEKADCIWDFSRKNIEFLKARGFQNAQHLHISFHPSFQRFELCEEKPFDIVFFGAVSPRRRKILDGFLAKGLDVRILFGCYGDERDKVIARSKIVLNIHQFESNALEELRFAYLLSNRCFVISETSDHDPYDGGVVFAPVDQLAETCSRYLHGPAEERTRIAARGRDSFSGTSLVNSLKVALAASGREW